MQMSPNGNIKPSCRPEVELPDAQLAPAKRQFALSIGEGEPQLYQLEHVYIAPAGTEKKMLS